MGNVTLLFLAALVAVVASKPYGGYGYGGAGVVGTQSHVTQSHYIAPNYGMWGYGFPGVVGHTISHSTYGHHHNMYPHYGYYGMLGGLHGHGMGFGYGVVG